MSDNRVIMALSSRKNPLEATLLKLTDVPANFEWILKERGGGGICPMGSEWNRFFRWRFCPHSAAAVGQSRWHCWPFVAFPDGVVAV